MTGRRADHTRTSRIVLTGLWADAALVMAASAYNGGQAFAALGQQTGAGIALGLAVDVGLAVALIGDRALHLAGRQSHWGRALRVCTAGMSLALNCAVALWMGHYGVAAFHAFLPMLLVLLSEYAQDSTLQFGEIAAEHAAAVNAERDAQLAADRAAWEAEHEAPPAGPAVAPIPPPVAPAFQAVTDRPSTRPDFAPAVQPADRPTSRPTTHPTEPPAGRPTEPAVGRPTGWPAEPPAARPTAATRTETPGRPATATQRRATRRRKRAGKPKTDQQLTAAIQELTERNAGRAPSQYQLRQSLGVGGSRAARLLAELGTTAPAGPPDDNGAAMRKEATP